LQDGLTTLCFKLAKFFDMLDQWDGCPIAMILLEGDRNSAFRLEALKIYDAWTRIAADHNIRLGADADAAKDDADLMMVMLQGAWVMARAQKSSDTLRDLPRRLVRRQPTTCDSGRLVLSRVLRGWRGQAPRQPGQIRKEAAKTSPAWVVVQPLTFLLSSGAPPQMHS
jgi:hypothetical protein